MIQYKNHSSTVLNGNEFLTAKYYNVEVDFCGLDEGGAMEKINDVEILIGLDFLRGRNDVVGMSFFDRHDGGVVMQKWMSFCDHHHYDGSDVKEKVNGQAILNGNCHHFLSTLMWGCRNTDAGMGFGDHHYDGAHVKEKVTDDLVPNGN